jgi:hypothetical protein
MGRRGLLRIIFIRRSLVFAKCETDKSDQDKSCSGYHHPMWILHCGASSWEFLTSRRYSAASFSQHSRQMVTPSSIAVEGLKPMSRARPSIGKVAGTFSGCIGMPLHEALRSAIATTLSRSDEAWRRHRAAGAGKPAECGKVIADERSTFLLWRLSKAYIGSAAVLVDELDGGFLRGSLYLCTTSLACSYLALTYSDQFGPISVRAMVRLVRGRSVRTPVPHGVGQGRHRSRR